MEPVELYQALEKLAREVVPPGDKRDAILRDIEYFRRTRPNDPPGKGLLGSITEAGDRNLYSTEHSDLVHDIAFNYC
jgi:hypothetical protein